MLKKIIIIFFTISLSACSTLSHTPAENSVAAEINAKLALAYLDRNNLAMAKEKLLLAQKQAPSDPVIWYVSGYFLEKTGDTTAAQTAYLHAIELSPHLGTAQNNYGVFLCRQGQYTDAITHFLLATKDPNYLNIQEAYKNAAHCARKIPDHVLVEQYTHLAQ